MALQAVDWATIHSRPLISVPDCWKGCGGFCCSNDHPDFQFRLLPGQGRGTTVIYLEDEYRWLKANGHAICGEEGGKELTAMRFDYGGPQPLSIRHAPCAHLGRCDHITKPLLCRIYPFMPIMDVDGGIEEVLPASIVDATFLLKEARSHCPLVEPGSRTLHESLEREPELAAALRHPTIILYTQAIRAFMDSYRTRLNAWDGFRDLSGTAFWQAWEMAYLGRRLVDRDQVAAHLRTTHQALVDRYGPLPA